MAENKFHPFLYSFVLEELLDNIYQAGQYCDDCDKELNNLDIIRQIGNTKYYFCSSYCAWSTLYDIRKMRKKLSYD